MWWHRRRRATKRSAKVPSANDMLFLGQDTSFPTQHCASYARDPQAYKLIEKNADRLTS